jgi:hypothetical protein
MRLSLALLLKLRHLGCSFTFDLPIEYHLYLLEIWKSKNRQDFQPYQHQVLENPFDHPHSLRSAKLIAAATTPSVPFRPLSSTPLLDLSVNPISMPP